MHTFALSTALLLVAFALETTHVCAHGQLLEPMIRPISTKFRADGGTLRQAGDDELQWSPLELLRERKQADQPQAATFDIMNGCRGTVFESGNPVTNLEPGATIPIEWFIQAPHPGFGEFNIVKPKTSASGKIAYERVAMLKHVEPFGTTGGTFETTATVPANIAGCEKAGACALQMYWYSEVANQTYPSCADVTIRSSGSVDSASRSAPSSGKRALRRGLRSGVVGSSLSARRDDTRETSNDAREATNEDSVEYEPATVARVRVADIDSVRGAE